MNKTVKIRDDYNWSTGSRLIIEGPHSGEDFRIKFFYPMIIDAIASNETLTIDFDGGIGYGTSWLEEVFGGVIRKDRVDAQDVRKHLRLIATQQPYILRLVDKYMKQAEEKARLQFAN